MEEFASQVGGRVISAKIGGGGALSTIFPFFNKNSSVCLPTRIKKSKKETQVGWGWGRGLDVGLSSIKNSECFY